MSQISQIRLSAAVVSAFLAMGLGGPDNIAQAETGSCTTWEQIRPYLAKFYRVEGEHRDNFIANFNAQTPHSTHHPETVGYTWAGGWDLVRVFMFENGCLALDRTYPRLAVWRMMGAYPAPVLDFDKSGARYAREAAQRSAVRDRIAASGQPSAPRNSDWDADEEMPLAGGVGEMD